MPRDTGLVEDTRERVQVRPRLRNDKYMIPNHHGFYIPVAQLAMQRSFAVYGQKAATGKKRQAG
jgi:hypothetical protein